jgi:hypothetical protein
MSCARENRSALLSLTLCLLAITSCRTASEPAANQTPPTETVVSNTPPFKTKEPEHYLATRTITTMGPNGERFVVSRLIGRDGPITREDEGSEQTRIVYLDSPDGRSILWPEQKVYATLEGNFGGPPPDLDDESDLPVSLGHAGPTITGYQSLGNDSIAGRSAAKYRIIVNSSAADNVNSVGIFIWIDQALNMPVKTEMRSQDGVVVITELTDIKLSPDKQLFQIPAGYEKIPFSALQKQLKARGLNP